MTAVLERALARAARAMADVLISFAAEVESAKADGAEASARANARRRVPPKPPGGSAPAEPVSRARRSKIDPAEFAKAWAELDYAGLMARFDCSEQTVAAWRKKLDLPRKSRKGRKFAAAPAPKAGPARPVLLARAEDNAAEIAATPPARTRPVTAGIPAAAWDETAPVSIDTVIKFLRSRDVGIGVLPQGGYRIDGLRNVDRAGLLKIANRKRALMGKPEFVLQGTG